MSELTVEFIPHLQTIVIVSIISRVREQITSPGMATSVTTAISDYDTVALVLHAEVACSVITLDFDAVLGVECEGY